MSYYNDITGRESLTLPTEIGSYKGLSYPRDNSKAEAAGWLLDPIVPFVVPEGHIIIGGTRRIEVTDNVPYEIWDTATPAEAEAERQAAKPENLKVAENNFILLCDAVRQAVGEESTQTKLSTHESETKIELIKVSDFPMATELSIKLLATINEIQTQGGSWSDIVWHSEVA